MELTYLKTFREVSKWGSFTKAAEELGYAQSSVTAQIQKLEEAYGAVLLERYGRKMRLTVAGESLLAYAHEIVRLNEQAREHVSKQSKGTLTIGTIETLAAHFLPPYLQAYRKSFPEMNVILRPSNEPEIIEAVLDGEQDIGIILDPRFEHPDLHCLVLREEELVIAAHPNHRLAGLERVRAEDLENESLILTEDGCSYRAMLLQSLKNGQVDYRLAYQFGNQEAIKQCVIYELGIALLPRIVVAEDVRNGRMVAVPFDNPASKFYTQLIYSKKKWQSKAFLGFLELFDEMNDRNHR
ncbi:LysR family transcriptional regulator [Cohnella endophytica]|uniref:LysR family transcriptional regulator n=1 Tax=Cohnella endophytica TaxID=2419778 RepID=A0A494XE84_9BACL|nr:LysR family transcriptional regulator [Cohnella endophytica]RKP47981.1 LysR family transcriptional regulator [Cohnella endophytica]